MTKKSKKTSLIQHCQYATIDDFDTDAKIYVANIICSDVIVETSHKNIVDSIKTMQAQLKQDGRDEFMYCFRSIASAIRSVNVDKVYSGMRIGRADDVQTWQNFCDDTVLHAVARFVLWKRMIPIKTQIDEFMKL